MALVAGLFMPACPDCRERAEQGTDLAKNADERGPNVVLMLMDTLRADRLGVYGYDRPTSPAIDALARESVLFEAAHGAAPWTLPSVISMMTSTFACEHGVLSDHDPANSTLVPLAERMKRAGFETRSTFANPYAGPKWGMNRGFDSAAMTGGANRSLIGTWIAQRTSKRPFFWYLHNIEPHDPYDAPVSLLRMFGRGDRRDQLAVNGLLSNFRKLSRLEFVDGEWRRTRDNTSDQQQVLDQLRSKNPAMHALYDAEVRQADMRVSGVVTALKSAGLWENTLFVLVSDHGEELGEHGYYQHDQSVYEELVHVPFLVHFPGGRFAGRRVETPVSLVDVLPTILAAVGRSDLAEGARGRDVATLIESTGPTPPAVVSLRMNRKKHFRPIHESRGDQNVVVRDGDWKFIFNVERSRHELYRLDVDPAETKNLVEEEPARATRLLEVARSWFSSCRSRSSGGPVSQDLALDATQEDRLRALGYVE